MGHGTILEAKSARCQGVPAIAHELHCEPRKQAAIHAHLPLRRRRAANPRQRLGGANAILIGHVTLGPDASVWHGAVLRTDNEPIVIGANSNVQENAVLHTDPGRPLTLGDDVSVGHMAMLHRGRVGDGSLVGIQAVLLNGATIGRGRIVAARALVTEDTVFADGSLMVGSPAALKRALSAEQIADLRERARGQCLCELPTDAKFSRMRLRANPNSATMSTRL